jgi:hypothetical protein
MELLKCASIHRFDPETGLLTGTKDGNLVNIFLRLFGKCSEKALCIRLLIFQVDLCTLAADYYFTSLQICFLTISVVHAASYIHSSMQRFMLLDNVA